MDVSVRELSKQYHIGALENRQRNLRETVVDTVTSPLRKARRLLAGQAYGASNMGETIWALRDVSFDVERGEVVGIIGRNGAGKTTLLKILSRITNPTHGHARIRGRVAALLNVGTGFHQELTGRENVYLNGAILGMKKADIDRKFDEIVDFSEIEKFIDTPVKRYSSGMQVRLAFAVAAHIEPDVLVVDEVLAVGDIGFQRKCLGKMETVAEEGRTVLFVSHRMDTVEALCSRCILLENGHITRDGETRGVIDAYHASFETLQSASLRERSDRQGLGRFRFVDTWMEDEFGNRVQIVSSGRPVKFVMLYEIRSEQMANHINVSVAISKLDLSPVTDLSTDELGLQLDISGRKSGRIECIITKMPINGGRFYFSLMARSAKSHIEIEDSIEQAGMFDVRPGPFFDSGFVVPARVPLVVEHIWRFEN